jgi:hypothetical protein
MNICFLILSFFDFTVPINMLSQNMVNVFVFLFILDFIIKNIVVRHNLANKLKLYLVKNKLVKFPLKEDLDLILYII